MLVYTEMDGYLPAIPKIEIFPAADGAKVKYPHDVKRTKRLKMTFPGAVWLREERCWHILGTRAVRRAQRWASLEISAAEQDRRKAEQIISDADWDGVKLPPQGSDYLQALRADGIRISTIFVHVCRTSTELRLSFSYRDKAVWVARDGGGLWDQQNKEWVFPISAARAVHAIVKEIDKLTIKPLGASEKPLI